MRKFLYSIVAFIAIAPAVKTQAQSGNDLVISPIYEAKLDSVMDIMQRAKDGDADCQNVVGNWYFEGKHVDQSYATAAKWWSNAAANGSVDAIGNLGICYHFGLGVECDTVKAKGLYIKSIEKGSLDLFEVLAEVGEDGDELCSIVVAECYLKGIGVGRNKDKAIEYLSRVAKDGSVNAQRELALVLLNDKNPKDAAVWFKRAADGGDLVSTYYYGWLLYNGRGVSRDVQNGVIYLLKAAEGGLPQSQYFVGTIYASGKGLPLDETQAVEWFTRAACGDNANAMWELGECYRLGKGVAVDFNRAAKWYSEAVATGKYKRQFTKLCEEQAGTPFMKYLQGLKAYLVDKNYELALSLFKEVEKAKYINGKTMQAVILRDKNYAKRDDKKAFKMFKQAWEKGDPLAAYYMGLMYESGQGVEQNADLAMDMLKASAEKGCAAAMCYIGDICYEGRGYAQNYQTAVNWYLHAQKQLGLTSNSAKRLAHCYEEGLGGLDVDAKAAKKTLETKNVNIVTILKLI
ncbi:MAG: sel1 repeat family protein [Muribaculaceae bacterium]|nr:sel1 repeat family protein [Muribaculaceae bacterium]